MNNLIILTFGVWTFDNRNKNTFVLYFLVNTKDLKINNHNL